MSNNGRLHTSMNLEGAQSHNRPLTKVIEMDNVEVFE